MEFVFVENLFSHYRREGEIKRDVKGDSSFEVVAQEITTFLILVGIYFPSVTGTNQTRLEHPTPTFLLRHHGGIES